MKTTLMKNLKNVGLAIAVLALNACSNPPLSPKRVQYQVKSSHALGNYAAAVSKGFTSSKSSAKAMLAGVGGTGFGGWGGSGSTQYEGVLLRQAQESEI